MSLVADQLDIIKSEPGLGRRNRICGRHCPCIYQIRVDHDHSDDCAQKYVASEYPGGAYSDQDRQEYERRVAEQMDDGIRAGIRHIREHIAQSFQQAHQKAAGNDRRYDRHEYVSQRLDQPFKNILLGSRRLLDFFLRCSRNSCRGYEFLIYFIYHAGAEDDLQLSGCFKDTFHAFDLFQFLFAASSIVADHQAKSCGTVGG